MLPLRRRLGGEAPSRRDKRRILRNATVRVLKYPVRVELLRRFQHRRSPATKQFGAAGPLRMRKSVQPIDELVIELHEYLSPAHGHMVRHMATRGGDRAGAGGGTPASLPRYHPPSSSVYYPLRR